MTEKKLFEITEQALSIDDAAARVSEAELLVRWRHLPERCAARRRPTTGVRGTDFLVYEAYAEMAERMLAQIGDEIQAQWPKVQAVCILHRIGRCEVGEASVVIAVSTPHRNDGCFEACQLCYRAVEGCGANLEAGELVGRAGMGGRSAPGGTGCVSRNICRNLPSEI